MRFMDVRKYPYPVKVASFFICSHIYPNDLFLLQFPESPERVFSEDWILLSVLMAEYFQPSDYIRIKHTMKRNIITVLSSLTDKEQWSIHCMFFIFTEYLIMLCITVFIFHIRHVSHSKTFIQIPKTPQATLKQLFLKIN